MGSLVNEAGVLLGGGPNNSSFNAQGANITPTANTGQLNQGYNMAQGAIGQQQALANALNAQNGIGNQSQVFNQLQGIANGTGPNPAQAMLNQATGANVANQAALMAGQRGAGANVGLLARQAAQQGANTQQQAVGQGATLEAQQQLGAINAAGSLANQQAANQLNQTNALTGSNLTEQQALMNAINANNQANIQNASQQNAANVNIAGINAKGAANTVGGIANALGGAAGQFMGSGAAAPASVSQMVSPADLSSVGTGGGAAAGAGLLAAAKGGVIPNPKVGAVSPEKRFSGALQPHVEHMAQLYHPHMFKAGGPVPGKAQTAGDSPKNDTVPAMLSPGEGVIPRSAMQDPKKAHAFLDQMLAKKLGASEHHDDFHAALKTAIASRKSKGFGREAK